MRQIQMVFETEICSVVSALISPSRKGTDSTRLPEKRCLKKFLYSKIKFKKGERFLVCQHAYLYTDNLSLFILILNELFSEK